MSLRESYPLGPIGLWLRAFDSHSYSEMRDAVVEIEELGWPSLWIPEVLGRESFAASSLILHATSRITVATGIASIWGRDPITAAAAQRTLTEAFPERFVLGLGVSHDIVVQGVRGQDYSKPLTKMRSYLRVMDAIPYQAPAPSAPLRRVLAALGDRKSVV